VANDADVVRNYVGGQWRSPWAPAFEVPDPARGEVIARVPRSDSGEVGVAVSAASRAQELWRRVPANERVQPLFTLKQLMEAHAEELASIITTEHGKTIVESRGEVRRALDNIEMACGTPALMQGRFAEDITSGIDELLVRQPVGVCAAIVPFNFPLMIPCWFLPYALACGNTFILKASERTPMTATRLFELMDTIGLPPGVVNLVHGDAETSRHLIEHPEVRAISFVGSTPAARAVYADAAAAGKRVQAQGGARNTLVVMPDANVSRVAEIAAESAFGNAGQRCLAGGLAITVGSVGDEFAADIAELAQVRVVGPGLQEGTELGPLISGASRDRVRRIIGEGEREGATLLADGRDVTVEAGRHGYFLGASVVDHVRPGGTFASTEVFGPVLGILRASDIDEALRLVNSGRYGNMACLFTGSGEAARRFRYDAQVGNVGVNVGVAQPMSSFPFSGWRDSFFGDLHAHGSHAIEFFTQTKVVVERWP
jgi:malonate-semialdehyde dehydrogenase (acetylating) / methylmalonate-semialdehyde dehydrogenase